MLYSMQSEEKAEIHRRFEFTRARIVAAAVVSVLGVFLLAGVGIGNSYREVHLVVDGVERPLTTWDPSIGGVLATAGIEVRPDDQVLVDSTPVASRSQTRVARGSRVEITTASSLPVTVSGQRQTVRSVAGSVHELLIENSTGKNAVTVTRAQASKANLPLTVAPTTITIENEAVDGQTSQETLAATGPISDVEELLKTQGQILSPFDEVHIRHDAKQQIVVTITRVERQLDNKTSNIAFTEKEEVGPDLFVGESIEITKGVTGVEKQLEWVEKRGGEELRVPLEKQVESEPVEEVKQVGQKEVTPQALVDAGFDPQAPLVETTDEQGRVSVRYEAKLGTISSPAEIAALNGADEVTVVATPNPGNGGAATQIPLGAYSGTDPRGIAQEMLAARGLSNEFSCLLNLWERESGWNPYAENASSGAYGIPQALPGSKMATAGADWRTNPRTQILWGIGYIEGRYGTPCGAWGFFQTNNWY